MKGLTVGRIVHYVAYGTPKGEYQAGAHRAAIITEINSVYEGTVTLMICNPTGTHFNDSVPHDANGDVPGTWHWIERE